MNDKDLASIHQDPNPEQHLDKALAVIDNVGKKTGGVLLAEVRCGCANPTHSTFVAAANGSLGLLLNQFIRDNFTQYLSDNGIELQSTGLTMQDGELKQAPNRPGTA